MLRSIAAGMAAFVLLAGCAPKPATTAGPAPICTAAIGPARTAPTAQAVTLPPGGEVVVVVRCPNAQVVDLVLSQPALGGVVASVTPDEISPGIWAVESVIPDDAEEVDLAMWVFADGAPAGAVVTLAVRRPGPMEAGRS